MKHPWDDHDYNGFNGDEEDDDTWPWIGMIAAAILITWGVIYLVFM